MATAFTTETTLSEPASAAPPRAEDHCLRAFAAVQGAAFQRAEQQARRALDLFPHYALAHALLALALRGQGRFQEAEKSIRRALEIQPENPDFLFVAGLVAWSAGDPHEAHRSFQKAIERCPDRDDMLLDFSAFLLHQRRFEDALVAARRAETLVPDHPKIPLLLLCATEGTWRPEVDTLTFRPPLPLDPGDPESFIRLGLLHMDQGYFNFALEEFSRALDLEPENARVKSLFATAVMMREAGFYGWARSVRQSLRSPRFLLLALLPPLLFLGAGFALYQADQAILPAVFGALAGLWLLGLLFVVLAGGRMQPPEEFDRLVRILNLTPQGRRRVFAAPEKEGLEAPAPRPVRRRAPFLLEEAAPRSGDPRKAEELQRLYDRKQGLPQETGTGADPTVTRRQMQDRSRLLKAYSNLSAGLFVASALGLVWVVFMMNTGTQTETERLLEKIVGALMALSIGLAFFFRWKARELSEPL